MKILSGSLLTNMITLEGLYLKISKGINPKPGLMQITILFLIKN
jgi:hypothetical protein